MSGSPIARSSAAALAAALLRSTGRLQAGQHRVQRGRLDQPRNTIDHRFGQQVLPRDVVERLDRQRRPAGAGHQLGALERDLQQMLLQVVIVLEVSLFLALLGLVQRRLRDVDVAALDQVEHLPVEKGQQQRADVRAVDVGVGHDDDAVVAQLVDVVFILAEAGAERGDQRDDFLRADQLVESGSLDVQDLAAQRKDRLELAVAALLGRAAGRITFDQVELAQRRIALLAIGELARQGPCRRGRPCVASVRAPCARPRARAPHR